MAFERWRSGILSHPFGNPGTDEVLLTTGHKSRTVSSRFTLRSGSTHEKVNFASEGMRGAGAGVVLEVLGASCLQRKRGVRSTDAASNATREVP